MADEITELLERFSGAHGLTVAELCRAENAGLIYTDGIAFQLTEAGRRRLVNGRMGKDDQATTASNLTDTHDHHLIRFSALARGLTDSQVKAQSEKLRPSAVKGPEFSAAKIMDQQVRDAQTQLNINLRNLSDSQVKDQSEKLSPGAIKVESAKDVQIGGDHYKKLGHYQPWEVLAAWMTPEELRGYMKGTVIAYLAREQDKGGDQDVAKALHTMQLWQDVRKDT